MTSYYWIKSNGEFEIITKEIYNYLKNQQYLYDDSGASNHHLLIIKRKSKIDILHRQWIPDIPIDAIKKIIEG